MTNPIIRVDRITKSFPTAFGFEAMFKHGGRSPRAVALQDVQLEVGRGELFGLLGPNGSGKTTLLKLIATLAHPDRGRIFIDAVDVAKEPRLAQRLIGLCPSEERSFYFRLTGRQNLEFFGALAGLRRRELRRRIDAIVELIDLGGTIDRPVAGFSSGMRQRLAVGRALLADPPILLLDEPTRAVDPIHADDLRRLVRRELVDRHKKTVVLATNVLEEAWSLCDRIAVFSRGTIVAQAPPRDLAPYLNEVTRYDVALDHVDDALLERARAVAGVLSTDVSPDPRGARLRIDLRPNERSLTELMYALSSNGCLIRELRLVEPEPVEVFRELMVGTGKP